MHTTSITHVCVDTCTQRFYSNNKNKSQMHPTIIMDLTYTVFSKKRAGGLYFKHKECTLYNIIYIKFKSRQKQFRVIEIRVIITPE